jgi:hypothetical protein
MILRFRNTKAPMEEMMYEADRERIFFLIERDTPDKVLKFANQAMNCYRKAALASKRKYGRGGAYRFKYIESYLFHKKFLAVK